MMCVFACATRLLDARMEGGLLATCVLLLLFFFFFPAVFGFGMRELVTVH